MGRDLLRGLGKLPPLARACADRQKSPRVESVPNGVSSALFGNQDTIPLMQTRLAFTPGFLLIAVVTRLTRGVRHRDPELGLLGGVASFYKVRA